jgi:hypothetical protein
MARKVYSLASSGTPMAAKAISPRISQRSCAIGKICWSSR